MVQGESLMRGQSKVLSAEKTGSVRLTRTRGPQVVVTGIVNGAVTVLDLAGLPLVLAGILGPATVAALDWDDVAAQPGLAALALLGYWAVFCAVLFAGSLLVRWFPSLTTATDAAVWRSLSRYRPRYRAWVLRQNLRPRTALALPTVGASLPELDAVFVDVSVVPRPSHEIADNVLADAPTVVVERLSIWEFLNRSQPQTLVVLGAPGSGKTTLLRHIARRMARRAMLPGRRTIPVLLEVRACAKRIVADPEVSLPDLVRAVVRDVPAREPTGWWSTRLRRGLCVVLLDGLDEVVRTADRAAVVRWLDRQLASFGNNHFVLTSRPYGYHRMRVTDATTLQVRPFTPDQVNDFLRQWYQATQPRESGDRRRAEPRAAARAAAEDLISRLVATPALHDLMVNPLLLTMIANVHRYRNALPESRVQLYAEVFAVMLAPRDEPDPDVASRVAEQKREALAAIAFALMDAKVVMLPRARILELVAAQALALPDGMTPEAFLTDAKANGLLIEPESDRCAFAHLTFQEYLTARYLHRTNRVDVLIRGVSQPWWRETTLLWVAGQDADPIVRACLSSRRTAALSLAFECADAARTISAPLRAELEELMASAYGATADAHLRRLIAGVEAIRHVRQGVSTPAGGRVCSAPVTTNLYWLFLRDTGTRPPDRPCVPDHQRAVPARGMWGVDALRFVTWINQITRDGGDLDVTYRLATAEEVQVVAEPPGPAANPSQVAPEQVWVTAGVTDRLPRLWTAPGQRPPNVVTGRDLREAVTGDVAASHLVLSVVSLGIRARAVQLLRLLDGLTAQADRWYASYQRLVMNHSEGVLRNVRSTRSGAERLQRVVVNPWEQASRWRYATPGWDHDWNRDYELLTEALDHAADPEWEPTGEYPLKFDVDGLALTGATATLLHRARAGAAALVDKIRGHQLGDTASLSSFTSALHTDQILAELQAICTGPWHADPPRLDQARTYPEAQAGRHKLRVGRDQADYLGQMVADLTRAMGRMPTNPVPRWAGVVDDLDALVASLDDRGIRAQSVDALLTDTIGIALASGRAAVLALEDPRDRDAVQDAFAGALLGAVGVHDETEVPVLLDALITAPGALARRRVTTPRWVNQLLEVLAREAGPVFGRAVPIESESAASIRLAALVLAASVRTASTRVLVELAAGTILLQRRGKGDAAETLLLAHL